MLGLRTLTGARLLVPTMVVLVVWPHWGCPPPPQGPGGAGPEVVLREYLDSLEKNDTGSAHRLLSARSRRETPEEAFQRFASRDPKGLRRQLADLLNASRVTTEWTATLRTEDGVSVTLIREGDGWRLDSGQVVPSAGFSPSSVVSRFVQAIEAGDCQALLACAPPETLGSHQRDKLLQGCRDKLEHLRQIAAQIKQSGGDPQLVSPDRAELTYHQNKKLIVTKHNSRWYIEDL
jgi:hypothetical protein